MLRRKTSRTAPNRQGHIDSRPPQSGVTVRFGLTTHESQQARLLTPAELTAVRHAAALTVRLGREFSASAPHTP
jgi:hypothetical protein